MYGTPVDQHWKTKANITLTGDAAHVMPPFAGVGVNMAMLDALELADCLTGEKYDKVQDALTAYEQHMQERTAKAQECTKDPEDIFHSPAATDDLLSRLRKETTAAD
jgi:2-polyprenyl-6-methoxyphenol hydroxylase-like FAD-dependent oxidoreductase